MTIHYNLTPTSKKIASLEIVVDKMHMPGHVDKWCMANCDPRNFAELNNVKHQDVPTYSTHVSTV